MSGWTAVSRSLHVDKHWRPRSGFGFAASQQLVPIMVAELAKLLPHYVLGFVKVSEDEYQAVAMLGLGGEKNLYVNAESQWLCSYVPAEFRAYPFALLDDQDGNKVFSIQNDHLSNDTNQPPLFDNEGELDKSAAAVFDFVGQREKGKQLTSAACSAIAENGLIEAWPISIDRENKKEPLKINGLYRISEDALNKLDAEQLAGLRLTGALPLAYGQLFSIAQIPQLVQRAEYFAKATKQAREAGLDKLFSSEDSGSLNFDAFESSNDDAENK